MICEDCEKVITFWGCYGSLWNLSKCYCKVCWRKRQVKEAKGNLDFWEIQLKIAKYEEGVKK